MELTEIINNWTGYKPNWSLHNPDYAVWSRLSEMKICKCRQEIHLAVRLSKEHSYIILNATCANYPDARLWPKYSNTS